LSEPESEEATPYLHPDRGLWVPPRFREFGQGVVFRTPRGTVQHYGSRPLDPFYGMVREDDFGSPDDFRDCQNPDLAPNKVSIKLYGEDAETFELEVAADE